MKVVNNDQEYTDYYQKRYPNYKPKVLPPFYPIIVRQTDVDGGLAGDYTLFEYYPINGFALTAVKGLSPVNMVMLILSANWIPLTP